jgi:hypothetical protein
MAGFTSPLAPMLGVTNCKTPNYPRKIEPQRAQRNERDDIGLGP